MALRVLFVLQFLRAWHLIVKRTHVAFGLILSQAIWQPATWRTMMANAAAISLVIVAKQVLFSRTQCAFFSRRTAFCVLTTKKFFTALQHFVTGCYVFACRNSGVKIRPKASLVLWCDVLGCYQLGYRHLRNSRRACTAQPSTAINAFWVKRRIHVLMSAQQSRQISSVDNAWRAATCIVAPVRKPFHRPVEIDDAAFRRRDKATPLEMTFLRRMMCRFIIIDSFVPV